MGGRKDWDVNCKPGDLATVVGGRFEGGTPFGRAIAQQALRMLVGRIVRVVTETDCVWTLEEPLTLGEVTGTMPDGRVFSAHNVSIVALGDNFLRPLPDLDEDDEVLREADKPVEVAA